MDIPLSDFGRRLTGSTGILRLMEDLGEAFDSGGPDLIMMGGGNPAHVPEVEAVWRRRLQEILAEPGAMETMLGDYDAPSGKRRFLEAFAPFLSRTSGCEISPEHVTVTPSSQTGFFLLLNILAGESARGRKRVLFPIVPEYIGYADQVLGESPFIASKPRIEIVGAHRFKYRVDFDRLAIPDDVAAICLSRPTNPSTNVLGDEELSRLSRLARERGCLLIVDNAYGLPFPGVVFSDARPCPWADHVVLSFSLSKLGLPTTRTGIVVAAPEIVRKLAAANAVVSLSNGSIGQVITEPLFLSGEIERLCAERIRPFYKERCRRTLAWIDELLGDDVDYLVHEPEGAFFLWIWFRGLPIDDRELYDRLKKRGLIVVPGSYFFSGLEDDWDHSRQCLRLSYCQPPERVRRGIEILAEETRRAYR
ncbi:MAG: valine--pyruvate transaminase [Vicinamibacteria bacterium]|nr:valine--pyruvate transaminase [Vicinamibacteria bacterium]